jgi:hypothetical protein
MENGGTLAKKRNILMAYSFPHKNLLQINCVVHDAEVSSIGKASILRSQMDSMQERMILEILDKATTSDKWGTGNDVILTTKVYVLSPEEIDSLIMAARAAGRRDYEFYEQMRVK